MEGKVNISQICLHIFLPNIFRKTSWYLYIIIFSWVLSESHYHYKVFSLHFNVWNLPFIFLSHFEDTFYFGLDDHSIRSRYLYIGFLRHLFEDQLWKFRFSWRIISYPHFLSSLWLLITSFFNNIDFKCLAYSALFIFHQIIYCWKCKKVEIIYNRNYENEWEISIIFKYYFYFITLDIFVKIFSLTWKFIFWFHISIIAFFIT